jgi:hypothetical protein
VKTWLTAYFRNEQKAADFDEDDMGLVVNQ